ncbi:MAG: Smr/MutS family protein [Eubacterium sp.]|nr:Smr/MutS family protein [Eubacterium sp.]
MPSAGTLAADLHGLRTEEAKKKIDAVLRSADRSVYTIRLIHGYRGGTRIRDMIEDEYGYGRNGKVIRVRPGENPGITELVLRD